MNTHPTEEVLMLDMFSHTPSVNFGKNVWGIEPSAVPCHVRLKFERAFKFKIDNDLSFLFVEHGAEYMARGRVKCLRPKILVDVWDFHMPEGEPREMMDEPTECNLPNSLCYCCKRRASRTSISSQFETFESRGRRFDAALSASIAPSYPRALPL